MLLLYYKDKQRGLMWNDDWNESDSGHMAVCLLEEYLTRANRAHEIEKNKKRGW
jgi:hypothetical protein